LRRKLRDKRLRRSGFLLRNRSREPESAKFPVKFPVGGEFALRCGAISTASPAKVCPLRSTAYCISRIFRAYRWFCNLGIEDAVRDHSAFSRARKEHFRGGDVPRRVSERVVESCIAAGLVDGERFAVDANLIQADANKQRSIAGQDWRRDRDPARSGRAVKKEFNGDPRRYGVGRRQRRCPEVCLAVRSGCAADRR
jgi:hypothetical protein